MKKIFQKIKEWILGKKEIPIKQSPVIVKSYTGSFDDMPEELKSELEKIFKRPPSFTPIPIGPFVSPFYEIDIDENGKPFLEEIIESDFDDDEEENGWGFLEEDTYLL